MDRKIPEHVVDREARLRLVEIIEQLKKETDPKKRMALEAEWKTLCPGPKEQAEEVIKKNPGWKP